MACEVFAVDGAGIVVYRWTKVTNDHLFRIASGSHLSPSVPAGQVTRKYSVSHGSVGKKFAPQLLWAHRATPVDCVLTSMIPLYSLLI